MSSLIFLGSNTVLERYIEACERQSQPVHGIIDTDYYGNTESIAGLPIIDSFEGLEQNLEKYLQHVFFVATNWNPQNPRDAGKRKNIIDMVRRLNLTCVSLVDPTSYVSKYTQIGQGVFVGSGATVEPRVRLDDFCNIGDQVIVGHDSVIGENTVLARNSGVHAQVGRDCYVSVHAFVWDHGGVTVGNNVMISPSMWVKRNVADNEHVTLDRNAIRAYRNHYRENTNEN